MSTEVGVVESHHGNASVHSVQFSGGRERGMCLQLSQVNGSVHVVTLTEAQVREQLVVMNSWLQDFRS